MLTCRKTPINQLLAHELGSILCKQLCWCAVNDLKVKMAILYWYDNFVYLPLAEICDAIEKLQS